jgi:K+-sensing histidine kinase KdpD
MAMNDRPDRTDVSADLAADAFLSVLSHEIRTPVTTLYAGSLMLAGDTLKNGARRAIAEDMVAESERLYRLVEDLLVLLRLERGTLEPDHEPVAVGHTVLDAIGREGVLVRDQRIAFSGARHLAARSADPTLVTHVIRNLLDNAVRYSQDRGLIEVVVEERGDDVVVRVLDRGDDPVRGGAAAFDLAPAVPAVSAQRAGAGIGLYVASRLIRAMGGRIWARDRSRGGSEFGFALPRARA